jgi:hypothetical protein
LFFPQEPNTYTASAINHTRRCKQDQSKTGTRLAKPNCATTKNLLFSNHGFSVKTIRSNFRKSASFYWVLTKFGRFKKPLSFDENQQNYRVPILENQ